MSHARPWIALLFLALIATGCAAAREGQGEIPAVPTGLKLNAGDLYEGFEATRVLLKNGALVLDTRNWRKNAPGVITTDVLDLGGEGVLTQQVQVSDLKVAVAGSAPDATRLTTEIRSGTTFFQAPGTWTEWQPADGVIQPKGRYVQVRARLTTSDAKVVPSVSGLELSWNPRESAPASGVTLVSDKVQRIVRSPVQFGYERPDQSDLAWLRKTFNLDEVIAGKTSEFEQLRALMRWVVTRPNSRDRRWSGAYPWDIRKVMNDENGGTISGHCMSYCEVMITAANTFGWQGRHWAILGFRENSHEVPEIWVNELGKWVFFDPSLDTYYTDQKTGVPMSILEMHNAFVGAVIRDGETLQMSGIRHANRDRVEAMRGRHQITCVSGDYAYGKPTKWDWQWRHGYLTTGWMQLTPRNNWHSQPKPECRYFEHYPSGYAGFPVYIDEKTPIPSGRTSLWYTRKRDLWWTLNQASFRLVRTAPNTLAVECGTSQPFFKRYQARIDAGEWKEVPAQFTWPLHPGRNRLELTCEDEFGKRGLASVAAVNYRP